MNDAEKIARLEAENAALRAGISAMHRRAQENEGAAHRLEKAKDGYANAVAYQEELRLRAEESWRASYTKLAQQLARVPSWVRAIFGAED